jgi:hypothetical protein
MRRLLLILIVSMAMSSQAVSPYFISDSGICAGALTAKTYDEKISLKYDTVSRESTMVCGNVCKWQYVYKIDSIYSISYLRGPLKIACFQCHSRESGNPFLNFHRRKMDSRFRGSDIKIKFYE